MLLTTLLVKSVPVVPSVNAETFVTLPAPNVLVGVVEPSANKICELVPPLFIRLVAVKVPIRVLAPVFFIVSLAVEFVTSNI